LIEYSLYVPYGAAGLHLITSNIIAVIYGKDCSSSKAGSVPGITTAAISALAFLWISGCNTIARMNVARLTAVCNDGNVRGYWCGHLHQTHGFSPTCQAFPSQKNRTNGGKRSISPAYIIPAVSLMMLSRSAYSDPGGKLSNSGKVSDMNEGNCFPIAFELDEKTVT
jgi:hypothetical protein